MIFFLFNWLVSSSFFFLRVFPYLKRKRNVVLLGISPFSSFPTYFFRTHLSLSYLRRFSYTLAQLSPPFVDAQCSRALNHGSVLVGLPLSSSGFWILAFSPAGSRRKGGQSRGRRPKDVARESADLSYLNVNDPTLLHFSSHPLVTRRQ